MGKRCVYCGVKGRTSSDHIPPRSLYSQPYPPNLITVPACSACNQQASRDDEYFRTVISLKDSTYSHPDVQANLPSIFRGLQRPENKNFTRSFLNGIRQFNLRSPGGIQLGHKWGFDVDLRRLDRVAERIVRGLFFHETRRALQYSAGVKAWSEDGLRDIPIPILREYQETVIRPLLVSPSTSIGNGTFEYRFQVCEDEPNASAWLLTMYQDVRFLCLTVPKGQTANDSLLRSV